MWIQAIKNINGNTDNSIGENFNTLFHQFSGDWFNNFTPKRNTQNEFYFFTFIFWLYLFQERIDFILKDIHRDNEKENRKNIYDQLTTIDEIRVWANFIKHPKEFMYSHFSDHLFEDEPAFAELPEGYIIVDFDEIK